MLHSTPVRISHFRARGQSTLPPPVTAHSVVEIPVESRRPRTKEEIQRIAMNETSKAMRRRRCEEAEGYFNWSDIFKGIGIDIGAGNDPVQIPGCRPFDMIDGDANHLSRYVKAGSLDYIHASQSLEHMISPKAALLDWATCVKKGGYFIISVPDFDLYESCIFPSRFNPDHKSAWSMWRRAHPKCSVLIHVPTFLAEMSRYGLECLRAQLIDTNFNYLAPPSIDQTWNEDQAEAFIEFVLRKTT
jgi:hypothetical protein